MKDRSERLSNEEKAAFSSPPKEENQALSSDSSLLRKMFLSRIGKECAWFRPLSFTFSSGDVRKLTIHLPHSLFFRWYSAVGQPLLEKTARELLGEDIHINYAWTGQTLPSAIQDSAPLLSPALSTFDDFISSGKNREALQLFRRFLHGEPGFMLLHGPSGTGKTHLLQAALSELQKKLKGTCILFSGRELTALFQRSPELAHSILLSSSAVLVDDLHLLEGNPSVQKELASILDSMTGAFFLASYQTDGTDESGQKLLPILYDRLCSRLSLGLAEPDLDVRLRFTQTVMEKLGLPEHRDTALFLARHCLRLRHIRGVIEQIRLRYEQNPSLPAENELSSLLSRAGSPRPVDTDSILAVVASRYGCTSSELCEKNKDTRLTLPRQIAMYLCRELLGESYPTLGTIFGGKDHSTVMYAVRKIEKLKVTNKDMNIQLTELTKRCRNGLQIRGN